jgi:hypothetical protein
MSKEKKKEKKEGKNLTLSKNGKRRTTRKQ